MPTRKIDFQNWLETIDCCRSRQREPKSNLRFRGSPVSGQVSDATSCHLDERLGVRPLAALVEEADGLVDDDLAVFSGDLDLGALEGTRRGPLEVDAGHVVAGSVAGAF